MDMSLLYSLLFGYALGSIPFGLILCFIFGYGDIRKIGSGNIGATNVLRTGNKILASVTLILDSGKGSIAVLLAIFFASVFDAGAVALGAVLGHNFPVWLKFKGGKGVATTIGAILALSWPVGLSVCLTWILSAVLFRISSLSALIALLCAPLFSILLVNSDYLLVIGVLSALVFIRHTENIKRLLKGEEPKIKFKRASKT